MRRKTGYHVWIFGACFWHRTLAGAWKRYDGAWRWASCDRQIIAVATGERIAGSSA